MQKIVAALALSGASALVAPAAPRATVKVQETKADLERLCAENPTALPFEGIWDPLGCADFNFWGLGNEATIGYLRHAEIKHGRIAMAGFLGFFVQSPGNFIGDIVSGDHAILPYRGYVAGCTPQEQWANIPMIGKLQILTAVGMLESYGEGAGFPESYTHYTKGGQPGYYPPIKGRGPARKSTTAPRHQHERAVKFSFPPQARAAPSSRSCSTSTTRSASASATCLPRTRRRASSPRSTTAAWP